MKAVFRNGALLALYFTTGLVTFAYFSLLDLIVSVVGFNGALPSGFYDFWFDNEVMTWVRMVVFVLVICLLTAAALKLRFFAIVVGLTLVLAAPLASVFWHFFYYYGTEEAIYFDDYWPIWNYDYTLLLVGAVLVTAHFVAPVRKPLPSPDAPDEDGGDEPTPGEDAQAPDSELRADVHPGPETPRAHLAREDTKREQV